MNKVFVDAESRSRVDIKKRGAHRYVRDPSTEPLLWAWLRSTWAEPAVTDCRRISFWDGVRALKEDTPGPLYIIHWGPFDRLLVQHAEQGPAEDAWTESAVMPAFEGPEETYWVDLQQISLTYGAPKDLRQASVFWTGVDRKAQGKNLIKLFCSPQKDGSFLQPEERPREWSSFVQYASDDVRTMEPIWARLAALDCAHDMMDHWAEIAATERMNSRGVPIDLEAVEISLDLIARREADLERECVEKYGVRPSQTEQVRQRIGIENVQKETLEEWIEANSNSPYHRLAEIRLETAGAARKKLLAMQRTVCTDGRARGMTTPHGAWNGRTTSQLLQLQNMVRSKSSPAFFAALKDRTYAGDILQDARSNIRGYLRAEDGDTFVAADYNAVELRVGATVAGEQWVLDMLACGESPYKAMAEGIFGIPAESISKASAEYDYGKMVTLACLYQLSGSGQDGQGGLWARCQQRRIDRDREQCDEDVRAFRGLHPRIQGCWIELQEAFIDMISSEPGNRSPVTELDVWIERWAHCIRIVRPSGKAQYFWMPRTEWGHWETCGYWERDGELIPIPGHRCDGCKQSIRYVTRKDSGKMGSDATWGGKLFQGIVSGIAADLIMDAMVRVERAGFYPVLTIHDELVCQIGADGRNWVQALEKLLCELPAWAAEIPIAAEGWQQKEFTK